MSIYLKAPGIESLVKEGNDVSRIGDQVTRNARMLSIANIESSIKQLSPLPVSIDVVSPEPPYFTYFSYCDVLGGILLQAGSAEISARITKRNLEDNVTIVPPFNFELIFDKYALGIDPNIPNLTKTAFLPGSNLVQLIDQSKLMRIMRDDWFIKPHPVTTDVTLREIGREFGYSKVFNPLLSGHQIFNSASHIATTQASEFFILAALKQKPLVDLTKYEYSWTCAYQCFAQCVSDDLVLTKERMEKALFHPNSGWIHPTMSEVEIDQRIDNYFKLAMQLRAPFKMVSSQVLIGKTPHIRSWDIVQNSKMGPRQQLE